MRKVVANTTPLIALSDIGQLELLKDLYGEIFIPQAVMEEIESEPARSMVMNAEWIKKVLIEGADKKNMFKARLHAGEVEAIILAEESKADLIIMDDYAAKKTAKYLGYNVTGTLGVLIKAKAEGYVEKIEPLIKLLIDDGLYIDQKTKELALEKAGEGGHYVRAEH